MRKTVLITAVVVGGMVSASAANAFRLTSPEIKPGGTISDEQVLNSFGCSGKNVSPALAWSGAPKGAKSFAISMYDPDAPTGSGFWHWVVVNIPADVVSLPAGGGDPKGVGLPAGALMTRTDFGVPGYGGPCPPKGDKPHHYKLTIFAVDVDKLEVDANTSAAIVGFNLHFHTLAKASLTATYGR